MPAIRTFIAIETSPEVQARAAELSARLQASSVKATWTKLQNLHLTLKFLGDTPDTLIPDVCRTVVRCTREIPAFTVRFRGAGAFPRSDQPRTIWLGVQEGGEQLVQLQAQLESGLFDLGFSRERKRYVPHLTLGRVRSGGPAARELGRLVDENSHFEGGTTLIEEVLVMASYLDREGPTYHVLGRAELVD